MTEPNNDPKRRELEQFCERYVAFWGFACLLAMFVLGWPAILTWVLLASGMRLYRDVMLGEPSSHPSRNTKPKRRCRD